LVLAVAALLALAALLPLPRSATGVDITRIPEGRLLRITHDDYVHVVYRIAQLRAQPPRTRTVYLFGGSGTMDSIVDEASLGAGLSAAARQRLEVVSLAAHQQSMAMTLALIDNLPPGPAVLAIGLAPTRLTTDPKKDAELLSSRPLLVRSPRLEALAERLYGERRSVAGSIPGFFDYVGSYLEARDGEHNRPVPGQLITYEEHYYPAGAEGYLPLAKRRNVLYVLEKDVELYRRFGAYNLRMLEEVIMLARERGYTVVLYDQPLNASAAGPDWAGVVPAYRTACREIARRYGVVYVHIERRAKLRDDDFADLFHLLPPGRAKWQPEMARQIGAVLRSQAATVTPATRTAEADLGARQREP
jgi:hypothetical protein